MILIDYNAIAISNVLAMIKQHRIQVEEDLIRHMILNSIRGHVKKHGAEYGGVVICCDAGNYWRRDKFKYYKDARKKSRDDDGVDWEDLFRIIEMVLSEITEHFPYKVIRIDTLEADDIIAALVDYTQEFGQWEPVLIISGDKDFAQLQKYSNVKQYSPVQRKWITEKDPVKFLEEHILIGDRIDGVPNVLSADNCLADGIRQTALREKALKALLEDPKSMGEQIYKNYQRNKLMIDLGEIPESARVETINSFTSQTYDGSASNILNYLISKRCKQLMECAGDFTNGKPKQ